MVTCDKVLTRRFFARLVLPSMHVVVGFNGLSSYFGIQKDVHSGFVLRFVARPREHVLVAVCVTLTLSLSLSLFLCVCVGVCVRECE